MDYDEARAEVLRVLVDELGVGGSGKVLGQEEIARRAGISEDEVINIVLRLMAELYEDTSRLSVSAKEITLGVKPDKQMVKKLEKLLGNIDRGDNLPDWS